MLGNKPLPVNLTSLALQLDHAEQCMPATAVPANGIGYPTGYQPLEETPNSLS